MWFLPFVCLFWGKCLFNRFAHFKSQLVFYCWVLKVKVTQSYPTLSDPMDCSPPCCSVHGILQERSWVGVDISFSRESSWPRDRTQVFHTAGRLFTNWATREILLCKNVYSTSLPIFKSVGFLLLSLYIWILTVYQMYVLQIFCPIS